MPILTKLRRRPSFAGAALLVAVAAFLGIGMVVYHFVEGLSWLDGLFFAVVTATTVGYGNLAPHSAGGKIFTMAYILLAIVVVATFVNHFSLRTSKQSLWRRFFSARDRGHDQD